MPDSIGASVTADTANGRPEPFSIGVASLILVVQVGIGLNLFIVSPLLPYAIDDFGISNTTASLLVAGPVLLQAATGLPGSLIVSRWGARVTIVVGSAMVSLMAVSAVTSGFGLLLVLRLIGGAGTGLVLAGTGPIIKGRFAPRHAPMMNTVFLVGLSGGIAIGVASAAPVADLVGWQVALALFGFAMMGPTIAWAMSDVDVVIEPSVRLVDLARVRRVLSDRTVAGLVAADALVFVFYAVLTTWLPTFLNETRGMSLERAGLVTGLLPTVGIVSVICGGLITHHFRPWRPLVGAAGILVAVGGSGSFLLSADAAIVVAILLLGVGTWIYQPAFHTVPMQLPWMTAENVAVVWGTSMTIAGIGQFVAPIVVGASRDLFGTFVPGFAVWAVLALSLPVAAVVLTDSSSTNPAVEGTAT